MDDDVTREQRVLLDTAARFIERTYPISKVRDKAYDEPSFAAAYRRQAGDWVGIRWWCRRRSAAAAFPATVSWTRPSIAYVRGRFCNRTPLSALMSSLSPGPAPAAYEQRDKVLPSLMSGEVGACWAIATAPGRPAPAGAVQARGTAEGYELSGHSTFIQDAGADGWLLVTASTDAGPAQFLLPAGAAGVTVVPLDSLDVTRHFTEIHFDRAMVPASAVVGTPGDPTAALVSRQLALACTLTVAESVGVMHHDLDMTVTYAKERIAFGRPIGSFQAIKHLLADTSLALEMNKAVATSAAASVGADDYGLEAASIAKAMVGDNGIDLVQACFQVFGGIGFTWEHDQHLYLRRVTTDAALYGDPAWHRERLCQLAGL